MDRRWRKALAISQCEIVENGGQTIFTSDDDHLDDMWLDTSDQTSEDGDDDDDDDDWEYAVVAYVVALSSSFFMSLHYLVVFIYLCYGTM